MLFVIGSEPTLLNSVSGAEATPLCASLAKAENAGTRDKKREASFLTRDMDALDDREGLKGKT
jgi:hypothetical protein